MADPLSATASVIAISAFALQCCKVLHKTFWSLRKASAEAAEQLLLLEGLQSIFANILELETELHSNDLRLSSNVVAGVKKCLSDLQAAELLLRPVTSALARQRRVDKLWATIKWTSHDRQKLKMHLQSLELGQKLLHSELSVLNIRLGLRHITQQTSLHSAILDHYKSDCSEQQPMRLPHKLPLDIGTVSIRTMMVWYASALAWSFLFWLGPVRRRARHNSYGKANQTQGYGAVFATSTPASIISARLELSLYILWTQADSISIQWSLRVPRIIPESGLGFRRSIEDGDILGFQQILTRSHYRINDIYSRGDTFLHHAVRYNQYNMALYMLSAGVDVNAIDDRGLTPLHLAVIYGNYEIVRVLLDHGADLENRCVRKRSPLHIRFTLVIERILLCHGQYLDVSIKDENNWTLLHHLVFSERAKKELFEQFHRASRISLLEPDVLGKTVFHLTGASCSLETMAYILKAEPVFALDCESMNSSLTFTSEYDIFETTKSIGHWLHRHSGVQYRNWPKGDRIPTISKSDGERPFRSIFGQDLDGCLQSFCCRGRCFLQVVDSRRCFRSTWIFEPRRLLWFFEAGLGDHAVLLDDLSPYVARVPKIDFDYPAQQSPYQRFLGWFY